MSKTIFDANFKAQLGDVIDGLGAQANVLTPFRTGGRKAVEDAALLSAVCKLEKYFEVKFRDANANTLKALRDRDPRVAPAFGFPQRRKLLGVLGGVLSPLAVSYHLALGRRAIDPVRSEDAGSLDAGGAHADKVAARLFNSAVDNFMHYLDHAVTNILADWDAINSVFFPGLRLDALTKISPSGSDLHKRGKQVLILTFELSQVAPAPVHRRMGRNVVRRDKFVRRLVYKPSNLELDYLLLADTAAVRAALAGKPQLADLPPNPNASLLEKLNELMAAHAWSALDGERDVRFPLYRILPRKEAGAAATDADRVKKAYGYIEFLTNEPPAELTGALGPSATDVDDWVVRESDPQHVERLRDYYTIFGWMSAVALTFAMSDVHAENMIVHMLAPHLIDVEISFKIRTESLQTTLITQKLIPEALIGKHKSILGWVANGTATAVPTKGQSAVDISSAALRTALRLFATPAWKNALDGWLDSAHLADVVSRHTIMATEEYYQLQQRILNLYLLDPAPPATANATTADLERDFKGFPPHERRRADVFRDFYGWSTDPHQTHRLGAPEFALIPSETEDLLSFDIPIFFRKLGTMTMLDSQGRLVGPLVPSVPWLNEWLPSPNLGSIPGTVGPVVGDPKARRFAPGAYMSYYPAKWLFAFTPSVSLEPLFPKLINHRAVAKARQELGGHGIALPDTTTAVDGDDAWVGWGWTVKDNVPRRGRTFVLEVFSHVAATRKSDDVAHAFDVDGTVFAPDTRTLSDEAQRLLEGAFGFGPAPDNGRVARLAFTAAGGLACEVSSGGQTYAFDVKYVVVVKEANAELFRFDYPVDGLDDIEADTLLVRATPVFGGGAHRDRATAAHEQSTTVVALSNAATGVTLLPGVRWRIVDGNDVYHLIKRQNGNAIDVYQACSGLDMVKRQLDRLAGNASYRKKLADDCCRDLEGAFGDGAGPVPFTVAGIADAAEAAMRNQLPPPPVPIPQEVAEEEWA